MVDDDAMAELLRTGVIVPVRIVEETVTPGSDEAEFGLRLELSFDDDEFLVGDFLAGLRFRRGELHFDADYVRGRRMKTQARVRKDGTGTIETVGRGKSATHWIARLRGGKSLRSVDC